ncbi:MAG TPA: helix-hairpin-helix domain-containing protein [Acidobacteriaceae bacterium]|nr:helix-hairpin-helix domain-containing protein [Acidobacteriaceae bacterium]
MFRTAAAIGACALLLAASGCNQHGRPESDQQLRQQAQQATERAKQAADQAAAEARVAAANAERRAQDVEDGVKAGLNNGKGAVNVNTASRAELETLPGVTAATARRIEADRPYASTHDLIRKGAISAAEYDRIAGDVTAH